MVADRTTVEHRDASCAVVTGRRIRSSSLRARTYALDELARHHDYLGWLVTPSSRLTVTDCSSEDGGIVGTRGSLVFVSSSWLDLVLRRCRVCIAWDDDERTWTATGQGRRRPARACIQSRRDCSRVPERGTAGVARPSVLQHTRTGGAGTCALQASRRRCSRCRWTL